MVPDNATTMKVLVVVLNYRTPELAVRCLESLAPEVARLGSMRVVVTDNDSGDDSVSTIGDAIRDHGWDWCSLMPLEKNGGYAFGNNAGIRPFLQGDDPPDYVLLVNPDAFVQPNAVGELVRFMDARREAGIAGARIESPDGSSQSSAFRFPTAWTELVWGFRIGILTKALKQHDVIYEVGDTPMQVDWVSGAAMIIRTEVFEDVGLLDEGYFLYFEEVDFCFRARQAGWLTYHVPDSVVVHLQAQATGITDPRNERKRYPSYWFNSRRRFFLKNHGRAHAVAADLAFLAGYSTWRVRRVIQRKEDEDPPKFWYDFARNSTLVKGFHYE